MDTFPVLPVSQAEAARDAARRAAIFSGGHQFIWLTLKNMRRRLVSGIMVVNPMPYIDEMAGNITKFHLEVKGGETDFQFDQSRAQFRYAMLDCEHNRKFLASHFHLDCWSIDDDKIRQDIAARSKLIEEEIKGKNRPPAAVEPQKQEEDDAVYEEYYDKRRKKMIRRRRPANRGPKPRIVPEQPAPEPEQQEEPQQEQDAQQPLPDPKFAGLPASDFVTPRGVGVVSP